jgi:hypothetical protein
MLNVAIVYDAFCPVLIYICVVQVFSHATQLDRRNYSPSVSSNILFLKCNKHLLHEATVAEEPATTEGTTFITKSFVSLEEPVSQEASTPANGLYSDGVDDTEMLHLSCDLLE